MFWITFGVLIGTGIIYLLFADGKIQPWNNPQSAHSNGSTNNDAHEAHELNQDRNGKTNA